MATKEVKDLKVGDKINVDEESCIIKSIEKSKVAKHGKAKCRLILNCKGKEKIIIRVENEEVEVE